MALLALTLTGCSAIELYRAGATAESATANPTVSALEAQLAEVRASEQALAASATLAAATLPAPTAAPTLDAAESTLPASAKALFYGSVPIDSDRLNIIAALAFDAEGQLLAATRAGQIYALPDSDGDDRADETRLIFADDAEALGQVTGLVAQGQTLFLLHGDGLSLLRDSDGDGSYETVTRLSAQLPPEQSPRQASNGIVQAPDGRLFTVDINAGEILRIVLGE